jgi:hypothetical protein
MVEPAPLPADNSLAEWQVFGDAQTGRLGTQYERTVSSIEIVEKCEKRDAETVQALTSRSLLQRLTPW